MKSAFLNAIFKRAVINATQSHQARFRPNEPIQTAKLDDSIWLAGGFPDWRRRK
jgi:hypothetical protein